MNFNAATLRVGFISFFILSFVMTPVVIAQAQSDEEFICTFGSDKKMVSVVRDQDLILKLKFQYIKIALNFKFSKLRFRMRFKIQIKDLSLKFKIQNKI